MSAACVLAAALAGALAAPAGAAASAAGLEYEPPVAGVGSEGAYSLNVDGWPSESNSFVVIGDDTAYTVQDKLAPIYAGPGCEAVDDHELRCPTPETTPNRSVVVNGNDHGDIIEIGDVPGTGILPGPSTVEVSGGSGDDRISGSDAHELLHGDRGIDRIFGGGGFDRLDGGTGHDELYGDAGEDLVTYQDRTEPVVVDLGAGIGGERFENDELHGIEDVIGGRGRDRLLGNRAPNELTGGEGNARDFVDGRRGDDRLTGYRVRGGRGADRLDGHRVDCGRGRDLVYRGIFKTRGPYPTECETVLATFVIVGARPLEVRRRSAVFGVRCAAARCRGRLELRDRGGRLGRTRFAIRNPAARSGRRRIRIPLARRSHARVWTLRVRGPSAFHRDQFRTSPRRLSR